MIIDLSHRIKEAMPIFPGDPIVNIKTAMTFEKENCLGHSLSFGTHTGTHIDAPAHMIEGAKTLDQYQVETFVGRGRYVLAKNNVFSLEVVQNAGIEEGDIVMFNTEMSYRYHDAEYFTAFPAMSPEIAQYLVERKIKMVGVDTCSIDNDPSFPIHKMLLGADIPIIENLTNVEQLSGLESVIYALPLRLDLDGAPARVVADVK